MGKFYTLMVDNQDMIIGAALAIGGNLLISIAMNIQKYSLTCLQRQEVEEITPDSNQNQSSFIQRNRYLKSRLWWCGITLMVLGEVGNFMAYGFAPASVVAPLGTTTVVANTYIAIFFLGERFRCQDALGTSVIVVGAFLIVMFSTHDEVRLDAHQIARHLLQWPFLIYVAVEVGLFIAANYLLFSRRIQHVVLFILPAALLASATVISAKAVAGMVTMTFLGNSQLHYFVFYVMFIILPVTGVIQIRYVTQAMQYFNATVVVPTFFVFFTLSAILAGVFFYGEFSGLTFLQIIIFLFGCFFSFLGVFFISSGRNTQPPSTGRTTDNSQIPIERIPECPFPCSSETVQPQGDEEPLLSGDDGERIIKRPVRNSPSRRTSCPLVTYPSSPPLRWLSSREAPESLFNPNLHVDSETPGSPPRRINTKERTSPIPDTPEESSNNNHTSNDTVLGKSLSWDSSFDRYVSQNRTHRRVPSKISRTQKDLNGSSGSSSS